MQQASRRAFLRAAVLASATVAVPAAGRASALVAPARPTRLRRDVFTPLVGQPFYLAEGRKVHRAVLLEVSDLTRAKNHPTRFGLTFRIAGGARPPDGTFRISHPRIRDLELYAGAVGHTDRGLYEIVVNV